MIVFIKVKFFILKRIPRFTRNNFTQIKFQTGLFILVCQYVIMVQSGLARKKRQALVIDTDASGDQDIRFSLGGILNRSFSEFAVPLGAKIIQFFTGINLLPIFGR